MAIIPDYQRPHKKMPLFASCSIQYIPEIWHMVCETYASLTQQMALCYVYAKTNKQHVIGICNAVNSHAGSQHKMCDFWLPLRQVFAPFLPQEHLQMPLERYTHIVSDISASFCGFQVRTSCKRYLLEVFPWQYVSLRMLKDQQCTFVLVSQSTSMY